MTHLHAALPHRKILTLTGPDTLTLLERLVTHSTRDWSLGETRYGGLLTPQGKLLADWLALRLDQGVMLDVDAHQADSLIKRFKLFRLRSQVDIDRQDDLSIVQTSQPDLPQAQFSYFDCRPAAQVWRHALPGAQAEPFETGLPDYHAQRIRSGLPEQGSDFSAGEVFPADINMDLQGGLALNKGCFVGQEVISRMHRRGKIRKRSLYVKKPSGLAAGPGSEITAMAPIGEVTSLAGNDMLIKVRTDRLIQAIESGVEIVCENHPLQIDIPDWLHMEARTEAST